MLGPADGRVIRVIRSRVGTPGRTIERGLAAGRRIVAADRRRGKRDTGDERSGVQWNQNPYRMDGGNGGRSEADAAGYLLPYWMGRYHGFIDE